MNMKLKHWLKPLILLIVVLFACEKPTSYCWKCDIQAYKNYAYDGMPIQDTIMCDKTEDFVYRYEQQYTYSDDKGNGKDMICKKVNKQ